MLQEYGGYKKSVTLGINNPPGALKYREGVSE